MWDIGGIGRGVAVWLCVGAALGLLEALVLALRLPAGPDVLLTLGLLAVLSWGLKGALFGAALWFLRWCWRAWRAKVASGGEKNT